MTACHECEQEIQNGVITAKDTIALNKKLLNRQAGRFFCAKCLAEYLDVSETALQDKVEEFKEQGCTLF
jgi:biotin operon repressor